MERLLDDIEARVVGCLVEKDLATPEYYPLTLNALTNACNQKSNRDPVMLLEETDVIRALDSLRQKQMAHQSAEGVRAAKYCHNLEAVLNLDPEDLAVLAELLLRGPQTVGELRNRAERMCPRKEHRFTHLLSGIPEVEETSALPTEPARLKVAAENDRITSLEEEVAALRTELDEVSLQLKAFQAQFE
jgi:uncharacterized protein YceH (UPF0502 family)